MTVKTRKRILLVMYLFASLTKVASQVPDNFPALGLNDLPEMKSLRVRQFTGESLFGYMNGGAELYREYGIESAVITEFDLGEGHFKCEIFKMKGNEAAFGIYSVSNYRCLATPPLSVYTCQTRYHLQICKGVYYVSIINSSGSETDWNNSLLIGEIIVARIKDPSFNPVTFFPDTDINDIKHNTVLAKGKLGLMNGATRWEDYFDDHSGYCALIHTAGVKTFISVRFSEKNDFQHFLSEKEIDADKLSVNPLVLPGGARVRIIGHNHLFIESAEN